ncbi:MAG TPA: glycoside hydrolase family 36 protein [Chthoniobacterales bacterium]|jgi:alpha-galactosidase
MTTTIGTHETHGFVFEHDNNKNLLTPLRLFGLALDNQNVPRHRHGLAALFTSRGRFDSREWAVAKTGELTTFTWEEAGVRWVSTWEFDATTGIIIRKDALTNTGADVVRIHRAQARLTFAPARYRAYTQESLWCHEFQGAWNDLPPGGMSLTCENGRTTENVAPYLALSPGEGQPAIAFNLIPNGNWSIHLRTATVLGSYPYLSVEMGLADENLSLELAPGATLELPVILMQSLPDGRVESGTAPLHRYQQRELFAHRFVEPPICYNTWIEFFEMTNATPEHMDAQVAAAKQIGCECFVVDVGWYGILGRDGLGEVGNWSEAGAPCFPNGLKAFADEVRSAGMTFGLWIEPERVTQHSPVRQEHPEWFRGSLIDLQNPDAYAWLKSEMVRLIETYNVFWIRLDFNFHGGVGADMSEGYFQTHEWFRLLGELRAAYPERLFEGCASGGMRLDAGNLAAYDAHFFSDHLHPEHVVRLTQGATLHVPLGRLTKWNALRNAGPIADYYSSRTGDIPDSVIVPCGPVWDPAQTVPLDLALVNGMLGVPGFTGNIAGLAPEHQARCKEANEFYKKHRVALTRGVARCLTPIELAEVRRGWIVFQVTDEQTDTHFLYVFRFHDNTNDILVRPLGLASEKRYTLSRAFHEQGDIAAVARTGSEWQNNGFRADVRWHGGAIWTITPES